MRAADSVAEGVCDQRHRGSLVVSTTVNPPDRLLVPPMELSGGKRRRHCLNHGCKPLIRKSLSCRGTRGREKSKAHANASSASASGWVRTALLHWQRCRRPAVLRHRHDVSSAIGGGAGHEVDLKKREIWLALARPNEDAVVWCLGYCGLDCDAGIAVVGW